MADLFPVSLAEQIACVEREIGYRGRVYVRLVSTGKLSREKADRELELMRAVLATLKRLGGEG